METALQILNEYWGYDSFREPQERIIASVLNKKNTIALLPTGGGKSICFQVPALVTTGVCIVVSPLIALMEDQVNNLKDKNIKATTIPSGTSQEDIVRLFDNIRFGNYKFLYLSPERLQSKFIQDKIAQLNVNLIAVDEAHCISEWGHDFRPSYLKINILKEIHPEVPIIALTATATQKVIDDITTTLRLKSPTLFKKSFKRDNLAYQIYFTEDKLYKLQQIVKKIKAPSIVYVNTRNKTKEISAFLNANGYKSCFYHGGMSAIEKSKAFDSWMKERTPIVVATNAFGMGIDKPNVRVVVHLNLPNSVENYVQEAGRGGRDGKKAFSVVLTNESDIEATQELQLKALPTLLEIREVHLKLYQHYQIAKGELIEDAFEFDLVAFCNKYNFIPNKTFNCLQILHNNGVVLFDTNPKQKSSIRFVVSNQAMQQYKSESSFKLKAFLNYILRFYAGVFENDIHIDEFFIAKQLETTSWTVVSYLEKLKEEGILEYTTTTNNTLLYFLHPREDNITINRISNTITSYLQQKHYKTKELVRFIKNDDICRSMQILYYFGEKKAEKCGMCDVCLNEKQLFKECTKEIIDLLVAEKELTSREIANLLLYTEADILINLRNMLSEEIIALNNYNKYFLI